MKLKFLIDEDFSNYKTCAMFVGFPYCTFKCEKDCGIAGICANSALAKAPIIDVPPAEIVARYMNNPISSAIVFGGLEPFDSFESLLPFVALIRLHTQDPIIIYTGYTESEVGREVSELRNYPNIIIKFGRFVPNATPRYDPILGVTLVSDNQYAVKIS